MTKVAERGGGVRTFLEKFPRLQNENMLVCCSCAAAGWSRPCCALDNLGVKKVEVSATMIFTYERKIISFLNGNLTIKCKNIILCEFTSLFETIF